MNTKNIAESTSLFHEVEEGIFVFQKENESTDYENAIRIAISLGGDSDTIACITGGIAVAFYKEMPEAIVEKMRWKYLPDTFVAIIDEFDLVYGGNGRK